MPSLLPFVLTAKKGASSSRAAIDYPEQAIQESSDVEERLRSNFVASQQLVEVPIVLRSKKSSERERTEVQSSGTEKLMDEEELTDFAAEVEKFFENDQPSLVGDGDSEQASGELEQTPSIQDELASLFGDDASQDAPSQTADTSQSQEELSSLFGGDDPDQVAHSCPFDKESQENMAVEMEDELQRTVDEGPEEELDHDGHVLEDGESVISEEE